MSEMFVFVRQGTFMDWKYVGWIIQILYDWLQCSMYVYTVYILTASANNVLYLCVVDITFDRMDGSIVVFNNLQFYWIDWKYFTWVTFVCHSSFCFF